MTIGLIIPLIGELLLLSIKIADIIEKSKDINPEDKDRLRQLIRQAKDGVTYIDDTVRDGN